MLLDRVALAGSLPFEGFDKIRPQKDDLGVMLTSGSNLGFSTNYLVDIGQMTYPLFFIIIIF